MRVPIAILFCCSLLPQTRAAINWDNDVSLTADTTVTSPSGGFNIGNNENNDDVLLNGYTFTLTGTGDFTVDSQLQGAGNVIINLTDPAKTVTYFNDDNNYSGLTTVTSGILDLRTPGLGNNLNDLVVGGGANAATVTRNTTSNRELISDSATVTLKSNGTLEFRRPTTGSTAGNLSTETFGSLILEGGTLLNNSINTASFTPVTVGTLTLLQDSYIDFGAKMSLTFGDVTGISWTSGKILQINNWDGPDDLIFGDITTSQLAQIRFNYGGSNVSAVRIGNEIFPSTAVPEASVVLVLPLLGSVIAFREYRLRKRRN